MNQFIFQFPDLEGQPSLRVDQDDGTVSGLDAVLPLLRNDSQASEVAQLLNTVGEGFEKFGHGEAACQVYEAAARVMEAVGNTFNHAASLNNLGLAYKRCGRLDAADACYARAAELLQHPQDKPVYEQARLPQLASTLTNRAILARERGNEEDVRRHAAWAQRIVTGRADPVSRRVAGECRQLLGGPAA